jgi:hypothetical protein
MTTIKILQFPENHLVLNLKGTHRHKQKQKHMAWNKIHGMAGINGMETILKAAN